MCYFEVHTLFAVLEVEGDCFAEFVQAEKGFFVVDTIKAEGVNGADGGVDVIFTVSPTP